VLYRNNDTYHHWTGRKFKCYPTYDFACPIVDAIEGVTHSMRSIEYWDWDALYHWVIEKSGVWHVKLFEFAWLNFKYTLMSKRKLQ